MHFSPTGKCACALATFHFFILLQPNYAWCVCLQALEELSLHMRTARGGVASDGTEFTIPRDVRDKVRSSLEPPLFLTGYVLHHLRVTS